MALISLSPLEVEYFLKNNSFSPKAKDVFSIAMIMKNCSSHQLTEEQKFSGFFLTREAQKLGKTTQRTIVMDLNRQREKLLEQLTGV
jgi:hypothetical protein